MKAEERDKKIKAFLANIKMQLGKAESSRKKAESYQRMAEHEFELMAPLCPYRSAREDRESELTMRGMYDYWKDWDCDVSGDFCEFTGCPMIHGDKGGD